LAVEVEMDSALFVGEEDMVEIQKVRMKREVHSVAASRRRSRAQGAEKIDRK